MKSMVKAAQPSAGAEPLDSGTMDDLDFMDSSPSRPHKPLHPHPPQARDKLAQLRPPLIVIVAARCGLRVVR